MQAATIAATAEALKQNIVPIPQWQFRESEAEAVAQQSAGNAADCVADSAADDFIDRTGQAIAKAIAGNAANDIAKAVTAERVAQAAAESIAHDAIDDFRKAVTTERIAKTIAQRIAYNAVNDASEISAERVAEAIAKHCTDCAFDNLANIAKVTEISADYSAQITAKISDKIVAEIAGEIAAAGHAQIGELTIGQQAGREQFALVLAVRDEADADNRSIALAAAEEARADDLSINLSIGEDTPADQTGTGRIAQRAIRQRDGDDFAWCGKEAVDQIGFTIAEIDQHLSRIVDHGHHRAHEIQVAWNCGIDNFGQTAGRAGHLLDRAASLDEYACQCRIETARLTGIG